jgi:dynactin complex subunit
MNDYLRTRIDALTREVSRLEKKVEFLEAVLEVEHNNNYKHKTEC